eukprot:464570_1
MPTEKEMKKLFEVLGQTLISFMDFATIGNLFKVKIGLNWDSLYPYNKRLKLYVSKCNLQQRLNVFRRKLRKDTCLHIWNIHLSIFKKEYVKHNLKQIRKKYQNKQMIKHSILYIIFYALFSVCHNEKIKYALNDITFKRESNKKWPSMCEIIDIELIWSNIDKNHKYETVSQFINSRYHKNSSLIYYNGETIKFKASTSFFGIVSDKENDNENDNENEYKFGIYKDGKNECVNIRDIIFGDKFIKIKTFYGAYIQLRNGNYNICAAVIDTNDKNKWNISNSDRYVVSEKVIVWDSQL